MTGLPLSPAERFGLDSNVLVYLVDDRNPARQQRAREIIDLSAWSRRCVLSTQNLGEFFNVVTRKGIVDAGNAQQKAFEFMALFEVVSPNVEDVRLAMIERIAGRFQFWDAHLLATPGQLLGSAQRGYGRRCKAGRAHCAQPVRR
jgi:predicted nucleic acid-binding protein